MKIINFKLALTIFASVLMLLTFSCSKEDGNNPVGGGDSGLIGSWSLTEATINPGTDSAQVFTQIALQLSGVSMVLVVNEGGTYSMTTTDTDGTTTETGSWVVSGSTITITPDGDTPTSLPYSIDNNTLTLTVSELEFGNDTFPALLKFTKQ